MYKYALDHLPKELCQEVYKQYTIHEKKFGSRAAIEDVIVNKRRFHYEEVSRSLVLYSKIKIFLTDKHFEFLFVCFLNN